MEPGSADADATDAGADDATIRIVWGTGTGPTALAAYDAALADAGVENYNLVTVSSVVPADPGDEPGVDADAAADRGAAGLVWATGPGPGLFYEVAGEFDESECRRRLEAGIEAGRSLRDWTFEDGGERVVSVAAPAEGYAAAVVLGAYGESEPIF